MWSKDFIGGRDFKTCDNGNALKMRGGVNMTDDEREDVTMHMLSKSLVGTILALNDRDKGPKNAREFLNLLDFHIKTYMEAQPGAFNLEKIKSWRAGFDTHAQEIEASRINPARNADWN